MAQQIPTDVALVKVTVNLLPAAYQRLLDAAEREGLSRTDVLNRAVQVYDTVAALEPGETVSYERDTGTVIRWAVGHG